MATSLKSPKNMRLFEATVDNPDVVEMIASIEANSTDTIRAVLEFVRKDVLYFLKSYTNVERPPTGYQRKFTLDKESRRIKVPKSDRTGWRPAHPGGWADISEDLKKKYFTDVQFVEGAWRLTIGNKSDHAVFVEARDGFFVVHGVLEPGGPVARSILRAIKALGLNWKVVGSSSGIDVSGPIQSSSLSFGPAKGTAPAPTEGDFEP